MTFSVIIPGAPVPQGRTRLPAHGAPIMPKPSRLWRKTATDAIGWAWKQRQPLDERVAVEIDIVVGRTTERPRLVTREEWVSGERIPAACRGDWDNYGKAVADALQDAGVLRNDLLIVRATVAKWYGKPGEPPHVAVVVGASLGVQPPLFRESA